MRFNQAKVGNYYKVSRNPGTDCFISHGDSYVYNGWFDPVSSRRIEHNLTLNMILECVQIAGSGRNYSYHVLVDETGKQVNERKYRFHIHASLTPVRIQGS